jgi:hypothetical protein
MVRLSPRTQSGLKRACSCRVGLAQLVRFLVVELTHSGLNHKFDMNVIFMANYFFQWETTSPSMCYW